MTRGPPAPAPDEEGWQKLDVRMLLLDPVKTLAQFFIPLLIGLIGLRNSGDLAAVGAAARDPGADHASAACPG